MSTTLLGAAAGCGSGLPEGKRAGVTSASASRVTDAELAASVVPVPPWASPEADRALGALDVDLRDRSVVMLGEPDHYIHEKYAYQLAFVKHLFAMGVRHVGFEMGRARGRRFDRFIETGREALLSSSARSAKSAKVPSGTLAFDPNATWHENDAKERAAFMRALRALSLSRPDAAKTNRLHVFGFDVDLVAEGAWEDVEAALEDPLGSPTANDVIQDLHGMLDARRAPAAVPDRDRDRDLVAKMLERTRRDRAALDEALGDGGAAELVSVLTSLEASLRFAADAMEGPTHAQLIAAYTAREQSMMQEVDARIAGMAAGERMVLIGHDMHLGKDFTSIAFGPKGEQPMWPSIGAHVASTLGPKAYMVWMTYARGTHGDQQCREAACAIKAPKGVMEERLATLGERYLLPLRERTAPWTFLSDERSFIQNGEAGLGRLARTADLIVFVRDVRAPDPAGAASLE